MRLSRDLMVGIAYSEDLLHLFDGAVAADKGGDKNLVFLA